ncbi:MAG: isocitrate lyase/phosphoenolpyruvate mutase family protein, partial [Pseudomonadota bacterium]|nr:isocitrate lyase/phosphoenolpyruvate mutase family protein [Pseudomonadota bacterium]
MSATQSEKAARFRALHQGPGAFVIANPWDAGSARILAGLGFQALATSSGACAGTLGRRDGKVTRVEALALEQAMHSPGDRFPGIHRVSLVDSARKGHAVLSLSSRTPATAASG